MEILSLSAINLISIYIDIRIYIYIYIYVFILYNIYINFINNISISVCLYVL